MPLAKTAESLSMRSLYFLYMGFLNGFKKHFAESHHGNFTAYGDEMCAKLRLNHNSLTSTCQKKNETEIDFHFESIS